MGEKDITEKNLEAWNDVFADIVNVLLFDGKRLIKEQELEAATKDSMFKADGEVHEQERDVSKFWKNGEIRISILGFENQTVQDYKMPLRVISYDGASYKQQLCDKECKQYYPVVTLVLYFGTDSKWTTNKKLSDCFKIPEELKPYVNDYKINLFEIAWLDDKTINKFQSDFKFVAQYFQTKRKNKEYVPSNEEIKHADAVFKMFKALTGDNRFESVYNELIKKKIEGGASMEKILDDFINKRIDKGREEGRIEGAKQQAEESAIKLLRMRVGTPEQIAQAQGIPLEKVLELQKSIAVEA